ncbi:hypothetical protein DFJ73DRAFT_829246 [Zopfochytrium polystomum]|nr:hypothetical protein DFJ73DRAFT_829246 [Zopfochytrium polystomum]
MSSSSSPNLATASGWTPTPAFVFGAGYLGLLVAIVLSVLVPSIKEKRPSLKAIAVRLTAWAAIRLIYMILRGVTAIGDNGTSIALFATVQAVSALGLLPLSHINIMHFDLIWNFPAESHRQTFRRVLKYVLIGIIILAITAVSRISSESSTPPYTVSTTSYTLRDTSNWLLLAVNALPFLVLVNKRVEIGANIASIVALQSLLLCVKVSYAITFNLTGHLNGEVSYYGLSLVPEIVMVVLLLGNPFQLFEMLHPYPMVTPVAVELEPYQEIP